MNRDPAKQWHGVFATRGKSESAEFIALMRVGSQCPASSQPTAVATRDAKGWQVKVDGKTVVLAGDDVSVR
jgi:hypothetical protein